MSCVDLQINGAFDVDFNDDALTLEQLKHCAAKLLDAGVSQFLPTIITADIETMCRRISMLSSFIESDLELKAAIPGLHIEGPFLSSQTGFMGTHPANHIKAADASALMRLLEAGQGLVRMVTLAPECDPDGQLIRLLRREKVIPMAGHTDATLETLRDAIQHGLIGFTHLGNGCAQTVQRHDNIIHRVLSLRHELWITLIADGIHLPFWLLQSWIDLLDRDKTIIVSDAISAAGMPPGTYNIAGQSISVDSSRKTISREHGYLAGSATLLPTMKQLLIDSTRVSESDSNRLVLDNPIRLLGLLR